MSSREDAIIAAYAAGQDEAEIERTYGTTREEIHRLVAGELAVPPPKPRGPGLASIGNRILLGVAVGFVAQIFLRALGGSGMDRTVVWVVVAAITYGLATALRR